MEEASIVVTVDAPLSAEMGFFHDPSVLGSFIAAVRLGVVDPVVESEDETVGFVLHVASPCVVLIHQYPFANRFVAVTALEEQALLVGPQDAVIEKVEAAREKKLLEENRALVHPAIIVTVRQDDDAPLGNALTFAIHIGHVSDQFADPHLPVAVEFEHAWHVDQGLGSDLLDDEAGSELEGLEGILNLEEGRWRNHIFRDKAGHVVTLPVALLAGEGRGEGDWEDEKRKPSEQGHDGLYKI